MMEHKKIIEEYPYEYCRSLEFAYGQGMMSEGGEKGIDKFFFDVDLANKKVLEIGFGLGGLAHYIARKYPSLEYHGIEINPMMLKHANKYYKHNNTYFYCLEEPDILPFDTNSFDVVFSKGVLVHLRNKTPLFKEVCRVLKGNGLFLINDWLSPDGISFGEKVDRMCEIEGLTLYPTTITQYQDVLLNSGFRLLSIEDENKDYSNYNHDIVRRLKQAKVKEALIAEYDLKTYQEFLSSYRGVAQAFALNELLARKILAKK
ncbi:methyltransferase domain-containing protein [Facilibium subflavum]|uniref:methyltransferase domain-containing protein n=1 Tax=Facilibium subflavum TaxID=2219058 RepID=UPI000E654CF3|nr:methyltransferase domain-containing protein [Facilibium subflavum]